MHVVKPQEVDVVIIGAGLAGLTAALELQKHLISFVVLEARNRAGGRIHTIHDQQFHLDLGAQWISHHHKRLMNLLKRFDIKTTPTYQQGLTIYDLHNGIKKVKGTRSPLTGLAQLDFFLIKRKINKILKELPHESPWDSKLGLSLDTIHMKEFIDNNMFTLEGNNFFTFLLEEEICTHLQNVSALDILWFIKSTGNINQTFSAEEIWVEQGVGTLIERITESIHPNILFNQPVRKIEYTNEHAIVGTDNETWRAKKVILTAPPHLTKDICFTPELPKERKLLESNADFPHVIKMVFIYETPFWRKNGLNGSAYSSNGPFSITMDSSPNDESVGILTVIIVGDHAQVLSKTSNDQRKKETINALIHFFGKEAASAIHWYEMDWSNETWTQGGYGSHFLPRVLTQSGRYLTKPIGPLHFAGTETATKWRLYMEGAIESGERVAHEILQCK